MKSSWSSACAARHYRREWYVGWPAVKAIVGNKIAPGLGDRYLASMGYDAQQGDEPAQPDRPHNLAAPLAGDYGAHGDFDCRSRDASWQLWLTQHRGLVALAGAGALCLAAACCYGANGRNAQDSA